MSKKAEIVKQEKTSVVSNDTSLPAHLIRKPGAPARGVENVTADDLIIPRLEIVQALSPCRKKNDPAYIEGIEEGMLYNSVTREVYGSKVLIVPVSFKKEYLLWKDRKQGGGFKGIFDTKAAAEEFRLQQEDAASIEVVDTAQHFCLLLRADGSSEEIALSLAKSKMKINYKKAFWVIVGLLALALVLLALKHLKLKADWMSYSGGTQKQMLEWGMKGAQNDAMLVSVASASMVNGRPFYNAGRDFQNYILWVSKNISKDVVVMDKNKMILGDTVSSQVGKKYMEDKGDEVQKTMADGIARTFTEKSFDYSQGITQSVVVMKSASGNVVGAVVMSVDKIK